MPEPTRVGRWFARGRCLGESEETAETYLVARTAPGERVLVDRVLRAGRRFPYASGVLEASPERVPPSCRHYDAGCSGCELLHVSEAEERRLKVETVREVFQRIAGLALGDIAFVGATTRGDHRARARFQLAEDGRLGLRALDGQTVLDVADCPANSPTVRAVLVALRAGGARAPAGGAQIEVVAGMDGAGVVLPPSARTLADLLPASVMAWTTSDATEAYTGVWPQPPAIDGVASVGRPGVWTQPHPDAAEALFTWVARLGVHGGVDVLDATCGSGALSIRLARDARSVTGVDASWPAVQAAREAVARAGAANVVVRGGRIQAVAPRLARSGARFGLVVVNPMREPLGAACMEALDTLAAGHMLYLAPAPAAGAKDLAALPKGWFVRDAAAVSLHPGTASVMAAVLLARDLSG